MKILTVAQTRLAEENAVRQGASFAQLMERAGAAAAENLLKRPEKIDAVWIMCGKGNNAGDGLVMARILAQAGKQVTVSWVLGDLKSELAHQNRNLLPNSVQIVPTALALLNRYDCIIDAVFGIGFRGKLSPDLQALFHSCSQRNALKVALDIPSGIDADSGDMSPHSFQANLTYAFNSLKPAHVMNGVQAYCGECLVIDIGLA